MLLLYSLSIALGQFSLWHWKNITPSYIVYVLYLTLWLVEKTRAAFPLNQSPLIATFSFTVSRASRNLFVLIRFPFGLLWFGLCFHWSHSQLYQFWPNKLNRIVLKYLSAADVDVLLTSCKRIAFYGWFFNFFQYIAPFGLFQDWLHTVNNCERQTKQTNSQVPILTMIRSPRFFIHLLSEVFP